MGAKLFRPFYRDRGEIGVNIEVSKRIGKPATYNTVLVKLWKQPLSFADATFAEYT